MRTVIKKWFWVWDFDKEERWLTEMAAKGLCLVGVGWCRYEFEDCLPGDYLVRMELLDNPPAHAESQKYISFIEETGAEQVGSYLRWVYFRRKAELGPFDLFSDNASRVRHLKRILFMVGLLGGFNAFAALYNLFIGLAWDSTVNIVCACLSAAVAVPLTIGFVRLWKKMRALQREQLIFE